MPNLPSKAYLELSGVDKLGHGVSCRILADLDKPVVNAGEGVDVQDGLWSILRRNAA